MDRHKFPRWLTSKVNCNHDVALVNDIISQFSINTVCSGAKCPNRPVCFNKRVITFMILGKNCTRRCRYCNIDNGKPEVVNMDEPESISKAINLLGIKHAVITSVTRDDLADGGAGHYAKTVKSIKKNCGNVVIELLIPDMQCETDSLAVTTNSEPDIVGHNIETVPRLYSEIRPDSCYEMSIRVLEKIKRINKSIFTKSGIMVGMGERFEEVLAVMYDLKAAGCDIITVGQYLKPNKDSLEVKEYIPLEVFEDYKNAACKIGFKHIEASPLTRSSFNADLVWRNICEIKTRSL